MNSQVMADRELLECVVWQSDVLLDELNGMLQYAGSTGEDRKHDYPHIDKLRALLATPAPIPDAGEGVRQLITQTIGFEFLPNELQTVNADDLLRLVSALQASAMVVPDGWIAVSERLPEDGQKITCSGFCFGKPENGRFVEWSIFEDGYFYGIRQDDNDEDCANTDITIHPPTHWMPQPPAPGDSQ